MYLQQGMELPNFCQNLCLKTAKAVFFRQKDPCYFFKIFFKKYFFLALI